MKVGDKFSSYEEFEQALAVYKKSVSNEFWIRDARTLVTQGKRFPESVHQSNYDLKYYYLKLACVKGGRSFISKNIHSLRKTSTLRQDCPALIFLRLSKCKKYLIVAQIKDKHNHSSSETAFSSLSKRRAKLTEVKPTNVIKKNCEAHTLCSQRKFSIVDQHCSKMAALCSQVSMPIFHKRIDLLKSIITLWSEGKDFDGEINLSTRENTDTENRQQVQTPTEIAETEQLVELPNDCKQLRVHIHVNIHPSLTSKGKCPKPQNNWQNDDIKDEEEEHEQEDVLEATEEENGQTIIEEGADQTEASEVYLEEDYLDNDFLPEDEYLEQEYLVDNDDEEENIPQLKNLVPEVRKRGRPKGSSNRLKKSKKI